MKFQELIHEVSEELNIEPEVVKAAYTSFWQFIKEKNRDISLEDLSEEEYNDLRLSFNIPSLGKLYTNYEIKRNLELRYKYIKELKDAKNKEDKTSI